MDLSTFISTTLTQILTGVKDAQKHPDGAHVAAEGYISSQGNLITGGTSGFFTIVDFDVSIAAETNEGGNSIRVAGIENSDASFRTSSNLNKVKFSVHLRIPRGGANLAGPDHASHYYDHDHDHDPFP